MTAFHDKPFDDATQMKLAVFRGYIREWLPVFMTRSKGGDERHRRVAVYDFFAGPGRDPAGIPGSPLIIVEEVRRYCEERGNLRDHNAIVRMLFNDVERENIERLRTEVQSVECKRGCCDIRYSDEPFQVSLDQHMPAIRRGDSANLVIMDQFGLKEVTPDVLRRLAGCKTTDVLFFISSSSARRFAEVPEMRKYIDAACVKKFL